MSFEKLREMEVFTEKMFNTIIGFQEKDHPAWDSSLPFEQRIAQLPLHYLIFSNPDRDPATHGPTVAHYYPLRTEMQTIAAYARQAAGQATICDLHARNGFIGSLLGREGVKVIGLRDPQDKPNQITDLYDPEVYELREGAPGDADFAFDVAFSSWMPAGIDVTPQIVEHAPKLIVYVFTEHSDPSTGERQTGTEKAFGDMLPGRYKLIDEWSVTRPENLLREVWPDLTGNIEETRHVRIYADEGFHHLSVDHAAFDSEPYYWEKELEMAQLAYQAKQQLREQGFPV